MLAMKIGSTKRKQAWSTRLREGDYLLNCKECGKGGTFIPVYRTQTDKKVDDFVPCSLCHGLYKKSLLYLHVQRCGKEPVSGENNLILLFHSDVTPYQEVLCNKVLL